MILVFNRASSFVLVLFLTIKMSTTTPANKSVNDSRSIVTELMMPHHANFEGKVNAGILLTLMDQVAFTCASRHAGSFCVTAAIDDVEFFNPIHVGDLVTLWASVNYVGTTSMIVGVKVEAENIRTGVKMHTNTSYFTLVAKDERGRPSPVPGLLLENLDDARRFLEALYRREAKMKAKVNLAANIKALDVVANLNRLRRERCEIAFALEM